MSVWTPFAWDIFTKSVLICCPFRPLFDYYCCCWCALIFESVAEQERATHNIHEPNGEGERHNAVWHKQISIQVSFLFLVRFTYKILPKNRHIAHKIMICTMFQVISWWIDQYIPEKKHEKKRDNDLVLATKMQINKIENYSIYIMKYYTSEFSSKSKSWMCM